MMKKQIFETYKPEIFIDEAKGYHHKSPSLMNGSCYVKRFRITVEPIEEPIEDTRARFLELWDLREVNRATHDRNIDAAIKVGESLGYTKRELLDRPAIKPEREDR